MFEYQTVIHLISLFGFSIIFICPFLFFLFCRAKTFFLYTFCFRKRVLRYYVSYFGRAGCIDTNNLHVAFCMRIRLRAYTNIRFWRSHAFKYSFIDTSFYRPIRLIFLADKFLRRIQIIWPLSSTLSVTVEFAPISKNIFSNGRFSEFRFRNENRKFTWQQYLTRTDAALFDRNYDCTLTLRPWKMYTWHFGSWLIRPVTCIAFENTARVCELYPEDSDTQAAHFCTTPVLTTRRCTRTTYSPEMHVLFRPACTCV